MAQMVFGRWCKDSTDTAAPTMHYTAQSTADDAVTACKRPVVGRTYSFTGRTIADKAERMAAAEAAVTCKKCRKAQGWS